MAQIGRDGLREIRDMTHDQLLAFYTKLHGSERVLFLIDLAHNLTVVARDAYFQGNVNDPEKLIKANEFQHRLTGIAADVLRAKTHRTDEQTIERIFMGFTELDAAQFVERVVARWSHDPNGVGSTT
jgi:hypothetical protein